MNVGYREREKLVHCKLYEYRRSREEVDRYQDRALGRGSRSFEAQIKSNVHGDPTAKAGIMLAEMPMHIAEKAAWCEVIESAWAECVLEDEGVLHGTAFVLEKNFELSGEGHAKEKNAEYRQKLCEECGISESTYYMRLKNATAIVMYHAARRGLI